MKTDSDPHPALERLFREVVGLAGRLKSARRQIHRGDNLPVGQRAVLHVLDAHWPLTASQIARRMGVSRQHVQAVVNRLLARGFLETHPNPAHLRSPGLQLSAAGRAALETLESQEGHLVSAAISGLDVEALVAAADLLRRIRKALPGRSAPRQAGASLTKPARPTERLPARKKPTQGERPAAAEARPPTAAPASSASLPPEATPEELPVALL